MHPLFSIPKPRALARSITLWVFGICTSTLLVGLWGRAVTTDQATLDESARAVLNSQIVNERLEDWVFGAVADLGDLPPPEAQSLVQAVLDSPEMDRAVEVFVDTTVAAALAPPDESMALDLEPVVDELEPAIDRALDQAGMPVDAAVITAVMDDMTLSSSDIALASSANVAVRGALTRVVALSSVFLAIAGGIALFIAEHRMEQLRSLLWRMAVSGFTFSVFLRIGAWAVDPSGGRSPLAAGSSVMLRSNAHVPFGIAVMATAAASVFLIARGRRKIETSEEDSTGEHRVLVDV